MKRIILLTFALAVCIRPLLGQVSPIYSVAGPDVANLGTFGAIPVSHYTGVPDVSVPLYEIKAGDYTFPITAAYHLASVKPNAQPGCLGLGWGLMAGGYIARTVRGVSDEKKDFKGYEHGFYAHASKMNDANIMQNFLNYTAGNMIEYDEKDTQEDWFELSVDEFSFNFCGYTGNFYYNKDGGWTVISDHDIKVEFDASSGFIALSQLSTRIPKLSQWGRRLQNQRYFCKFTLVTPDGCRYEFGGRDAMEFSINYYARNSSDLVATTWHLTRITTPDGREITFTYDTSALMCDLRYLPSSKSIAFLKPATLYNPDLVLCENTGVRGFIGFLLFPVNLKQIDAPNETITFDYFVDTDYNNDYLNHGAEALSWDTEDERYDLFTSNTVSPRNQFSVMMNGVNGSKIQERQKIAANLVCNILHRMAVSNKYGSAFSKSIYFEYVTGTRRKLSAILSRKGIPELTYDEIYGGDMIKKVLITPLNLSEDDMPEYHFKYDKNEMPAGYVLPKTDSWGYYYGRVSKLTDTLNFEIKPPSMSGSLAETLREIQYPTGGRSVFQYEGHRASQEVSVGDLNLVQTSSSIGGLRIRQITNKTREDSIINIIRYHYSEQRNGVKSSGIAKPVPSTSIAYACTKCITGISCEGGVPTPATTMNSPDIGYSCVIEETLDKDGKSLGYVKYRYSNYDTDIYGNSHLDQLATAVANLIEITANGAPYTSNFTERGKLLSKEYYDNKDKLLRKTTYRYRRTQDSPMLTATQQTIYFCTDLLEYIRQNVGWLTYTHTYRYLPVEERDSLFQNGTQFVREIRRSYNAHHLVARDTLVTSRGGNKVTEYKYPSDFPGDAVCSQMAGSMHILNPVVSQTVTQDGQSRTQTSHYALASVSGGTIPYIWKVTTGINNSQPRTHYEVLSTDSYGRPTEIVEDGRHSTLSWGFKGQRLMSRIENRTLSGTSQAKAPRRAAGVTEGTVFDDPEAAVNPEDMPGSLMHYYTYDGNMQLRSMTEPNGFKTFYEYDSLGKLTGIYFYEQTGEDTYEKRYIRQFTYHYYNDNGTKTMAPADGQVLMSAQGN